MLNSKIKKIIFIPLLTVVVCGLLFVGVSSLNNGENNEPTTQLTSKDNNDVAVITQSGALPQSANEIDNSVPSKETLENLPDYINKYLEMKDIEAIQKYESRDLNNNTNSAPSFFAFNETTDKIYAVLHQVKDENGNDTIKLVLTANKPEEGSYVAIYEMHDNDTGVAPYCKDYARKIHEAEIDSSVKNFHPVSTSQWFGSYLDATKAYSSSLVKITGLQYLNMDKVQDASFMFSGTSKLSGFSEEDTNKFLTDLSVLSNASGMFIQSGLENNTLNTFLSRMGNIETLKNCQYTFCFCNKLILAPSNAVNLPNVENASGMFMRSSIQNFVDSIVFGKSIYSVSAMFYECNNLEDANVSSLLQNGSSYYIVKDGKVETGKISAAYSMFESCTKLKTADFGKWDVRDAEDAAHINYTFEMFSGCSALQSIFARYDANWNNVIKDSSFMFAACKSIIGQNRTRYNDTNIYAAFARIDDGASNPGYFTISQHSPEAPHDKYLLKQNDIFYYPVCDDRHKLPSDIVFYDADQKKIPYTNNEFYTMSDLKNAKYFSGTSAFNSIRIFNNKKWDEVYYEVEGKEIRIDPNFRGQLQTDENLLSITDTSPQMYGVDFTSIAQAYGLCNKDYWTTQVSSQTTYEAFSFDASTNKLNRRNRDNEFNFVIGKKLDPNKIEPYTSTTSIFSYDDSIVEKVTNITGDKTYPKNTKIYYASEEFKFKVVIKDGVSVPRAFDGVNEIPYKDGVFTINNRYGCHDIKIDRQTKFNVNFDTDQADIEITDKDGYVISNPSQAILNGSFKFKIKYNNNYVVNEVKVGDNVLIQDEFGCYTINNITNHVNVKITSKEAISLTVKVDKNSYFYRPVFNSLSSEHVKFYNNKGEYIYPTSNNGHDYVMGDLKNVKTFIGEGYKFKAIRLDQLTWDGHFDKIVSDKATEYKGPMIDGDYCASLSFDKNNNRPSVNGVYLGNFVLDYGLPEKNFWGPDYINSNAYYFATETGEWDTLPAASTCSAVIEREFSDFYEVKFEGDSGVKQIVQIDDTGKEIDVTNGAQFNKNEEFKFRIKCFDDKGIDNIIYNEVSISGHDYEDNDLLLDNNSLSYKIFGSSFKHLDMSTCVIKASTINVSSFKTDKGLYHPIFKEADNVEFSVCRFYDDDGQCLSASNGDESDKKYSMKDITYTTKYKIFDEKINDITAVRSITESKFDDVFDRDPDSFQGYVENLKQNFKNKLNEGDNVCYFDYKTNPYISYTPYHTDIGHNDVTLLDVYKVYNQYGFCANNNKFHFFTNYFSVESQVNGIVGYYFSRYDDERIYYNDEHYVSDQIDDGCCMVVSRQFGKTGPSCTVEFHKDQGVEKITDIQDEEIKCDTISVTPSDNFQFHVYYKDGYVENQVKDGLSSLVRDKESNTYTVSNIQSQRVINIGSQTSCSLKSPSTSKHPGVIYKPLFDRISVNDVKFYDENGWFIEPSEEAHTYYEMKDLSHVKELIPISRNLELKSCAVVESTWDEAFGSETKKAEKYCGDKLDYGDICYTLGFNYNVKPVIEDFSLDDLWVHYFKDLNKQSFMCNQVCEDDPKFVCTYDFFYKDDKEGKWLTNKGRNYECGLVVGKTFSIKDNYRLDLTFGEGIDKIVDDKGQVITGFKQVAYGSQLRFKVFYKKGFVNNNVEVNGASLKIDSDGYYTLDNITSDLSINLLSSILHSLKYKDDLYYPVPNNLSGNDIQFYDTNFNYLPPTDHGKYQMSDLKDALYYACINSECKFQAIRSIPCTFEEVFVDRDPKEGRIYRDAKWEFYYNNTNPNDHVYIFNPDERKEENPMFENNSLGNIYDVYKIPYWGDHQVLTNWTCNDRSELITTYACSIKQYLHYQKDTDTYNVIVYREFSENTSGHMPQKFNFQKTDEIEAFTDKDGNILEGSVDNFRGHDFTFKIKFKEGHVIDKAFLNGNVITPNMYDVYTVQSNFIDNNITVTSSPLPPEPLMYRDNLYRPVFQSASFEDIHFYNSNGGLIYPDDEHPSYYSISDISNATQYIAKEHYQFKAICVKKEIWKDSFGEIAEDIATKYMKPMPLNVSCTTLSFSKIEELSAAKDLCIKDINQNDVLLKDIQQVYFDKGDSRITSFWTAQRLNENNVYSYQLSDNNWEFKSVYNTESDNTIFEHVFSNKRCSIKFNYDSSHIENPIDINGNNIELPINDFSANSNFMFKIPCKENYLIKNVLVNGKEVFPNTDGFYTIKDVNENLTIDVVALPAISLTKDGKLFHPIFELLPASNVRFFNENGILIYPTGNNGSSYLMKDLADATQFVGENISFDAVRLNSRYTWNNCFSEVKDGIATKCNIPNIKDYESCSVLSFEKDQRPYINGISIDNISNVYFGDSTKAVNYWTPVCADDNNMAYIYNSSQGWKQTDSKDYEHEFLIQTTFTSQDAKIHFSKSDGIESIIDADGKILSEIVDVIPGQDFSFKVNYKSGYVYDEISFGEKELSAQEDGYYHILIDASALSKLVNVKAAKPSSLKIDNDLYLPIFNELSCKDVKFFNDNGDYIMPQNYPIYHMSDLGEATQFTAKDGISFKAIRTVRKTWNECFESDSSGKPVKCKLPLHLGETCSSLSLKKVEHPSIYGISIKSIFDSYGVVKFADSYFWTNEVDTSTDNAFAYLAYDDTITVFPKDEVICLTVIDKTFTQSPCNIHLDYDNKVVKKITDQYDNEISGSSILWPKGDDLKLKVYCNDGYSTNSIEYDNKIFKPDADGVFTIPCTISGSIKFNTTDSSRLLRVGKLTYQPTFKDKNAKHDKKLDFVSLEDYLSLKK